MKQYDAVVIGGGILGCFAARNLRRWNISVLLIESADDVCTGITRANSAIVYAGYDMKPGTRKAEMTVRANESFEDLCRELDVPFSRCGSMMVSFGSIADGVLVKKYKNGKKAVLPDCGCFPAGRPGNWSPCCPTVSLPPCTAPPQAR